MGNSFLKKDKRTGIGSQENTLVYREYKRLKESLAHCMSKEEEQRVEVAFQLAWEGHKGVYRQSGEPYIIHSLRTAHILAEEIGLGITSVLSGILHDVVEDTSVSINKIRELFGSEVSKIVYGVTKVKKIFEWGGSAQAENFKRLLLHLTRDQRVILVKLADRLDNMRTLGSLPRQKQLKIASETISIYVPLAHRLGLTKVKRELEDLYLKHIYPSVYKRISTSLRTTQKGRERQIDRFLVPIVTRLKGEGVRFRIQKRVKSIYAIWRKMEKKYVSLSEIYDLIAVRIIIDCSIDDERVVCWQVLGMVCSIYMPNLSRFKDWVSKPKSNGYASLHTTVMGKGGQWVEVQIRTERMEEVASKGLAAHWRYKEDKPVGAMPLLDMWIKNVQQVLKEQKDASIEAIEDVRIGLSEDEISVFTKKGRVRILPKGATVLDFAIEERGMQGLRCSGALVNKKVRQLYYKLEENQQVEFIMDKAESTKRDWLEFLVTPKARRLVKKMLKKTYKATQDKGKGMVETRLIELGSCLNKETAELMREFFDEKTMGSLYYKIGGGKIKLTDLATFIDFVTSVKKSTLTWSSSSNKVHIDPSIKESGIMLRDQEKQNYRLAKCCNPIIGEDIFGVMSLRKPIKVHRIDCPNALYILTHQGDRIVRANWSEQERGTLLTLHVRTLESANIQEEVVNVLKEQGHITSASFKKDKEYMKADFNIEVKHVSEFTELIHLVRGVEGVVSAERYTPL